MPQKMVWRMLLPLKQVCRAEQLRSDKEEEDDDEQKGRVDDDGCEVAEEESRDESCGENTLGG